MSALRARRGGRGAGSSGLHRANTPNMPSVCASRSRTSPRKVRRVEQEVIGHLAPDHDPAGREAAPAAELSEKSLNQWAEEVLERAAR